MFFPVFITVAKGKKCVRIRKVAQGCSRTKKGLNLENLRGFCTTRIIGEQKKIENKIMMVRELSGSGTRVVEDIALGLGTLSEFPNEQWEKP